MDFVLKLNIGWNLGNTMDATGGETGWGNPITTKEIVDYALANDMYIILNMHHEDTWLIPTYAKFDLVSAQFRAM